MPRSFQKTCNEVIYLLASFLKLGQVNGPRLIHISTVRRSRNKNCGHRIVA